MRPLPRVVQVYRSNASLPQSQLQFNPGIEVMRTMGICPFV
jgi:hypothetical protein